MMETTEPSHRPAPAWLAAGLVLSLLFLLAWSGRSTPPATAPSLAEVLEMATVVDLSHAYDTSTLYWPTDTSGFQLAVISHGVNAAGFFYAANRFCTAEHGGTHLDAPVHFAEGAESADQVALGRLMAPSVVIDVSAQAAANPDYRLTVEDVTAFEKQHGEVAPGSIVLLRTDWSKRWSNRKAYFGDDRPGETKELHFPAFGLEAATLLIDKRQVAAIGLDTPSIDYGPSADFPVHRLAGAHGVPGFENLKSLECLPPKGAYLIALPMKIAGGSGAPLRAVALVPQALGVSASCGG